MPKNPIVYGSPPKKNPVVGHASSRLDQIIAEVAQELDISAVEITACYVDGFQDVLDRARGSKGAEDQAYTRGAFADHVRMATERRK